MWSFIKGVFGGSDNAGKTLDLVSDSVKGIGTWIDERDFTEEEKSKALGESVKMHLDLIKATTNENSLRSVTRRWLAWGITGFVLAWGSIAIGFAIADKPEIVTNIINVMEAALSNWVFLAVVGFYFGVQLVRK